MRLGKSTIIPSSPRCLQNVYVLKIMTFTFHRGGGGGGGGGKWGGERERER